MKNSFLFLVLIFGFGTQAQTCPKITLTNFDLKDKVVHLACFESYSNPTTNEFANAFFSSYDFDTNGYLTQTEKYGRTSKMTYSKNYQQQTLVDGYGDTLTCLISQTPARSFLAPSIVIVKNKDGSIQKVIEKTNDMTKVDEGYVHSFSYEKNTISIDSDIDQPHKQRFTKEGVLLSEENEYLKSYYLYHPISKLLTKTITKTKSAANNEYYINSYEYDTHGNWIVCYSYSAIPAVSNLIKPFNISVRTISYQNKQKTGYDTITDLMKQKAMENISQLKINNLDAINPYSLPLFVDYDLVSNGIAPSVKPN